MDNPHIEEVIRLRVERRGSGKDNMSPIRGIEQVFDKQGGLIMERDPSALELTPEMVRDIGITVGNIGVSNPPHVVFSRIVEYLKERGMPL